jgi:hypothetical protein
MDSEFGRLDKVSFALTSRAQQFRYRGGQFRASGRVGSVPQQCFNHGFVLPSLSG